MAGSMNIKKVYEYLEKEKNLVNLRGPDELLWQIAICNILIGNILTKDIIY